MFPSIQQANLSVLNLKKWWWHQLKIGWNPEIFQRYVFSLWSRGHAACCIYIYIWYTYMLYIYIYYDIICCIRYQYLTVSILHCMYMYYIYIHMWQYEFNAKNRMESDIHRRIWIYVVYWCVVICIVLMSRLHTGRDPGSFVRGNNFAMEPKYHVFFLIALHHRPSWCDKVYKAI